MLFILQFCCLPIQEHPLDPKSTGSRTSHFRCMPMASGCAVSDGHIHVQAGRLTLSHASLLQVCVKEWSVRDRAGIHAMSLAQVGSRRLGLPGNAAAGPLVYISSQSGDVGLWELRNGRCLQASPLYDPSQPFSLHSKGNYTCCTSLFVLENRMELIWAALISAQQLNVSRWWSSTRFWAFIRAEVDHMHAV